MTALGSGLDSLDGKTALVTGATSGIGAATARGLATAGAQVLLVARRKELLEPLANETGGQPVPLDLEDDVEVWDVADRLSDQLGGSPDIVVNAAGAFSLAPVSRTSVEDLDRSIAVNLRGSFLIVRSFLPGMIERGNGHLVNVGSVAGRKAFPENAAYSAAKFGLRGMHEVMLEELRGSGVRATLVEPGACDTPLWDAIDPDASPALPNRSDMLSADDVAEAILFVLERPDGVQIPLLQIERA